jgi:hypothetical protein
MKTSRAGKNFFHVWVCLFSSLMLYHSSFSPLKAASWEDEKKVWEDHANRKDERDPGYAAKLSLSLLPVDNGHFYVGEVGKGIWFSVGQTVSLVAAAVPVLNSQSRSKQGVRPVWTTPMVISASVGGFCYLALKVWSAYDAAEGARRYNAARRAEEKASGLWDLSPDGVTWTRRWGKKQD